MFAYEPRIRSLRTKRPFRRHKRIAEGEVEACCHRVSWWFDITGVRGIDDADLSRFAEEAEEHAKNCINDGCHAGQLCSSVSRTNGDMEELFGWWEIQS